MAIDARAAIRREIGGVERVAREMAARLPALRPERYEVVRPRPRLAHRAGHAWEQLALPLIARGAQVIYCPANLAPLASRRNVVTIHDVAALAHPEWYGDAYVAWQRARAPLIARRARLVLTVSEFSREARSRSASGSRRAHRRGPERRGRALLAAADPAPARAALGPRAALRARALHPHRAQEPRRADRSRSVPSPSRASSW